MAWKDATSIKKLSIILEDSTVSTNIYSNGLHQIGIVVYVEAVDNNNLPISITTDDIIQNTSLIDYVTGEKLLFREDRSWNYTDIENEFHIKGVNRYTKGENAIFYVQYNPKPYGLSNKSISVMAILTNPSANQKEYKTNKNGTPGFDSKVIINSLNAINYSISNKNIEISNSKINNGDKTLDFVFKEGHLSECIHWDQENYYLFIKNEGKYIKHVYTSGYNNTEKDHQISQYAFYTRFPESGGIYIRARLFNVAYIWPMSENKKKSVTLYIKDKHIDLPGGNFIKLGNDISVDIDINQVEHALCISRIQYRDDSLFPIKNLWRDFSIKEENLNWSQHTNITIYDQYGNIGKFNVTSDDSDYKCKGNIIQVIDGHAS